MVLSLCASVACTTSGGFGAGSVGAAGSAAAGVLSVLVVGLVVLVVAAGVASGMPCRALRMIWAIYLASASLPHFSLRNSSSVSRSPCKFSLCATAKTPGAWGGNKRV